MIIDPDICPGRDYLSLLVCDLIVQPSLGIGVVGGFLGVFGLKYLVSIFISEGNRDHMLKWTAVTGDGKRSVGKS
jgi:hypothetical protein